MPCDFFAYGFQVVGVERSKHGFARAGVDQSSRGIVKGDDHARSEFAVFGEVAEVTRTGNEHLFKLARVVHTVHHGIPDKAAAIAQGADEVACAVHVGQFPAGDHAAYGGVDGALLEERMFRRTGNEFTAQGVDGCVNWANGEVRGCHDDVKINGYETELIQVLINLLNNSKDALESKEDEK